MDSILQHLATTIMYDMSPKAFLEKYLVNSPVLQVNKVTQTLLNPQQSTLTTQQCTLLLRSDCKSLYFRVSRRRRQYRAGP